MSLINKIKNNNTMLAFLYFVIVGMLLFATNYKIGTWLTGWDNVHSEFNAYDNLVNKSFFGIWQEGYGLGAQIANMPITEVFRQPFVLLLSLLLPDSIVRYVWHLAMLVLGGFGCFLLVSKRLFRLSNTETVVSTQKVSLITGTLYMLNIGTLQNFYVPVESFSHFFAFLPLLVLVLLQFLEKRNKSNTTLLIIINLLSVPMNYFPTIFIVYLIILGTFFVSFLAKKRDVSSVFYAGTLIVMINAFWLLPFAYYLVSGRTVDVQEAKINRIFTADAYERNSVYGNIREIALLKGLWFSTSDFAGETYVNMMQPWINHLSSGPAVYLGYFVAAGVLVGFVLTLTHFKYYSRELLLLSLVTFVALNSINPPTAFIFEFLQNNVPLFSQVFRLSFTKFISVAALLYSIYFGYFVLFVLDKFKNLRPVSAVLPVVVIVLNIWFVLPMFQGNFFYSRVKVSVPEDYSKLYDFFSLQDPNTRIANFPQARFYGWSYYDWGYRGSGFAWYAIRQPILDRAFDVWDKDNEDYYNEISHALYTGDLAGFENTFSKYGVKWLWLDEHQLNPENPALLYIDELKELVKKSNRFKLVFEEGGQKVYSYDLSHVKSFVSVSRNSPKVGNTVNSLGSDTVYEKYGNYILESSAPYQPFSDLDTAKHVIMEPDREGVGVYATLEEGAMEIPSLLSAEHVAVFDISLKVENSSSTIDFTPVYPQILMNGQEVKQDSVPFSLRLPPLKLSSGSEYYFVLDKDVILFRFNGETVTNIGKIAVSTNQNTKLYLLKRSDASKPMPQALFDAGSMDNCSTGPSSEKATYGRKFENGVLTISGTNSKPCLNIPVKPIIGSTEKINVLAMDFGIQSNSQVLLCLAANELCKSEKLVQPNTAAVTPSSYISSFTESEIEDLSVKFELDAETLNIANNANLHNLSYSVSSLVLYEGEVDFDKFLDEYSIHASIPVKKGDSILIRNFPYIEGSLDVTGFSAESIKHSLPKNCDPLRQGNFNRFFATDFSGKSYVQYYAQDSSSCDSLVLPKRTFYTGAISVLNTMNILGRPITYCLKMDPPGYCLIFDVVNLPESTGEVWHDVIHVVPDVSTAVVENLSVLFDNLSFSQQPRVNRVSRLDIYPIPYSWLKSITVVPKSQNKPDYVKSEYIENFTVKKYAPFVYVITGDLAGRHIFFYQNYDNLWFALNAKEHTLFNGWGNSWLAQGNTMILIYVPQILAFIGFSGLLCAVVVARRMTRNFSEES